ncbi:uncharacterized protein LOC115441010 [Manduca sexta]|uniref:Uncharacterized protein n=1 Tax=Manduca sexta TaxID=7130 RepID=A0A922CGU7_MANSE|nr:uncharacterized protein LOC115441010 [Manduca sexta]XP_037297828.1 uncharacterized protein LOC115441010 [Manduca sexta]KAG6446299.1 hypothetical protein O3G_MSEX004387 [Manduca sexta]KAG6446300.1 hypothetical protein O3G_MSEX004387 [Manduca sexta]
MENNRNKIKKYIVLNKVNKLTELLRGGLDPNFEGGWPIRLGARYGNWSIVKTLIQFGADPHLLSESGASTLQLAVFSGAYWDTDKWNFLLSCCDSSQLADGAVVAVVFQNVCALKRILETKRCNLNVPTTLTGKTLEQLAKGYKLSHLLNISNMEHFHDNATSPNARRPDIRNTLTPPQTYSRNLSPSVARFFYQSASRTPVEQQRGVRVPTSSPTTNLLND